MSQLSAYASRNVLQRDCAILVCGTPRPDDVLAIELPNNVRLSGLVAAAGSIALEIHTDQHAYHCRPWENGDDPLPQWKGQSTRWTVL